MDFFVAGISSLFPVRRIVVLSDMLANILPYSVTNADDN